MLVREDELLGWRRMLTGVLLLVGMGLGLVGGREVAGRMGQPEFVPVTVYAHSGQSAPQVIPTGTCTPSWQVVTSPNPGQGTNYLFGVSAISANDVWAVGTNDYGGSYPGCATLTLHWDGQAWTHIPSPNVGDVWDCSFLSGVTAVSSNDVWAVGYVDTTAYNTGVHMRCEIAPN